MEVVDKGFQKHRRSLIPEWILRLTAFWRRVLKEVCGKTLNIVIAVQVNEGVITMALFHVDKVKNLYVIALFFQKISRIAEQFAFRVENNKTCIGVHDVWLGKEPCLTGTGTAAHKHVQVSSVLSAVKTDGDILSQQFILRLSFIGIFLVD